MVPADTEKRSHIGNEFSPEQVRSPDLLRHFTFTSVNERYIIQIHRNAEERKRGVKIINGSFLQQVLIIIVGYLFGYKSEILKDTLTCTHHTHPYIMPSKESKLRQKSLAPSSF